MVSAEFVGWMSDGENDPDYPPFPLFNIRGEHPKTGSTVGLATLRDFGIPIPDFPAWMEWNDDMRKGG